MNNKDKTALVPKLRFSEFMNSGEWKEKRLVNDCVANIIKESVSREYLNLDNYISTDNLSSNYGDVKKADKLPPSGSFSQYKKGDVLVSNIRPYLKKVWVANKGGTCSNDVIIFRAQENCNKDFLAYILKNDEFINYVMQGAKGVKMPRGDVALMKDYPTFIPKQKEQQKIADCLSSLDELLTAEDKKLNALKTHKKGLMQNLFPAEGETVPEWRFPEFRDSGNYPDWATVRLGDIGKLGSGGIDKKYNSEDQEVYMVNFMDVYTKKYISKQTYKALMKTTAPKEKLVKSLLKKHDMLFLLASETSDDIGHSIVIEDDFDDLVHSYHTVLFRPNIELDLKFQKYFCNTVNILRQFSKISKGQIRVFITKDDFNDVLVSLSCLEEQQKIADCLSSLDELITAQAEKIESLKLHKKGLMQGLFPSFEEAGE